MKPIFIAFLALRFALPLVLAREVCALLQGGWRVVRVVRFDNRAVSCVLRGPRRLSSCAVRLDHTGELVYMTALGGWRPVTRARFVVEGQALRIPHPLAWAYGWKPVLASLVARGATINHARAEGAVYVAGTGGLCINIHAGGLSVVCPGYVPTAYARGYQPPRRETDRVKAQIAAHYPDVIAPEVGALNYETLLSRFYTP